MATSNRIATTEVKPTITPPIPAPPPTSPPPSSSPTSPPATSPPATSPPAKAASAARVTLSRVIARDAARSVLSAGTETPNLWIAVSSMMSDALVKDWVGFIQDVELFIAALDVVLSPDDRAALGKALQVSAETSVLTDPSA